MKTEVQTFCTEFSDVLDPFSDALKRSTVELSAQNSSAFESASLNLQEVSHRLSALQEKIEGQQAYLLIFGPLKSGKSTLMNAISGAYVSEVSSLPAYPALVYVKNGGKKRFQARTYSGETIDFDGNEEMTAAIEEGHRQLAQRILDVENQGEAFDPKQHYPEAIRRMDVEAPAESLAESGTVLVDTPGLYSRMKFGYDLMTRDFRDSAACAIFVVKTDNLFFEKVFEEFNELLGCFSRIFLVANIDTSKNDLNPDGTLEPSLESSDPGKVISAFENLSMSAPLKQAYSEGRLRVYAIDLLKAASKRLRENAVAETGKIEGPASEPLVANPEKNGFDGFLDDLSDYLNSSDYLHDFMYDSLRFANDLRWEAAKMVDQEAAANLREEGLSLEQLIAHIESKIESLDSIGVIDWEESFSGLNEDNEKQLEALLESYCATLSAEIDREIDLWMKSDSGLAVLRGKLKDIFEKQSMADSERNLERLKALIQKDGRARFSVRQLQAFSEVELSIEALSAQTLVEVEADSQQDFRQFAIEPEMIPVKKTFWDFLLFRSPRTVSARFFGKDGGKPIDADLKLKKLEEEGLDVLKHRVQEYATVELVALHQQQLNGFVSAYADSFSSRLAQESESLKNSLQENAQSLAEQLKINGEAQKIFTQLFASTESFKAEIIELADRFKLKAVVLEEPKEEKDFANRLESPEIAESVSDEDVALSETVVDAESSTRENAS